MSGETNLQVLLRTMRPSLQAGEYVFCTVPAIPATLEPLCIFREAEGITIIVRKEIADEWQLAYSYVAAWIVLTIHSSLDAVGFTAAISGRLAEAGISCNVVAAYFHDHLFVPVAEASRAMDLLLAFQS
jgi:uncharacterized protein